MNNNITESITERIRQLDERISQLREAELKKPKTKSECWRHEAIISRKVVNIRNNEIKEYNRVLYIMEGLDEWIASDITQKIRIFRRRLRKSKLSNWMKQDPTIASFLNFVLVK